MTPKAEEKPRAPETRIVPMDTKIATGINWVNGHQAMLFWGTKGQTTTDSFEVPLKPGTYFFALSNTFSTFSGKSVSLEVDLLFKKKELVQP